MFGHSLIIDPSLGMHQELHPYSSFDKKTSPGGCGVMLSAGEGGEVGRVGGRQFAMGGHFIGISLILEYIW